MKRQLFSLALLFASALMGVQAQNAQHILDKTSATLKASGGIKANFETTSYKGNKPTGTVEGELLMQSERFRVRSNAVSSWFDGRTQWTLIGGSDEVNISTPSEAERQAMNPYAFVDIYKKGYSANARTITYNNATCYEVQLKAKDANVDLQELRLVINSANHLPLSIRMKRKQGDWTRIRVSNIRLHQKIDNKTFVFNKAEYPSVEIIDLR